MKEVKKAWICSPILLGIMLCGGANGQLIGMDWLRGASEGIDALNKNIQQNIKQLNQRIQQTVQSNLALTDRLTANLNEELARENEKMAEVGNIASFSNSNNGTTVVYTGQTSDGKQFVLQNSDKIEGDTYRHVQRILDPATNTTRVYGYTLDLKDPNAKPVPMNDVDA